MAREVRKEEVQKFLNKAESFYAAAVEDFEKGRFDVAVFDSSQAIILANDALCISLLGKRPSKDHREAIQLHIQALAGKESKRDILSEALENRSEFGYTEKSAKESETNIFLTKSKRFLEWVKERL